MIPVRKAGTYFIAVVIFYLSQAAFNPLMGQSTINLQLVSPTSETEQTPTDQTIHAPYTSSKKLWEHVLASPAYLFDAVSFPVHWSLKVAERNVPRLFQGERGPYGVYPLFELGGNSGTAVGLLGFHNKVTSANHKIRMEVLFGSGKYNNFELDYSIPDFLTEGTTLDIETGYKNDPVVPLFGGNRSRITDKLVYATEEMAGSIRIRKRLTKNVDYSVTAAYYQVDIAQAKPHDNNSDRDGGNPVPAELTGLTSLLSAGSRIHFDFSRGKPRINRGSRYSIGLKWMRSLNSNRHQFIEYTAAWNQFIPVFFLPDSRRLALKAELIKNETLGDKTVPFFEQPGLGGSSNLRGFSTNRFQNSGSLLFTLEYRYPMWSFADVVLFADKGQVFNHYTDIKPGSFHNSYGAGLHVLSAGGFAFRTEYAFSRETSRLILSINRNF
ncbi:MAG: BamA/TamA family outer membrane protein [Cyclonatronaceae bacterium]